MENITFPITERKMTSSPLTPLLRWNPMEERGNRRRLGSAKCDQLLAKSLPEEREMWQAE